MVQNETDYSLTLKFQIFAKYIEGGVKRGLWRHFPKIFKAVSKQHFEVKFPFTIYFHLSITIGTENTSLNPFWPNFGLIAKPKESKMQYFEKMIWETNSSFQTWTSPCFKVPSNIDFDLSITLDTLHTTLEPFYPIWR